MTHASRLRAQLDQQHERSFGQPAFRMTDEMAEREWTKKVRAGYDKRNIKCDVCFEYKSVTGECQCDD